MPGTKLPIVYVRGYAGTQSDVEETVDDPFYSFNVGSTHIRQDQTGNAEFFAFQSPFVRLAKDHGYMDVFDGTLQAVGDWPSPQQTVWIYRYYDPTSNTFDRPGGKRLSIEEAAEGLRRFIEDVLDQTKGDVSKVFLIAHSMGGLVCRSLIQKIYPQYKQKASDRVHSLFTYGTPHGGILFDLGFGVIEKLRDLLGVNNSDDFGRERMYRYLTPTDQQEEKVPATWDPRVIPPEAFDVDRVFCVTGTNAHDYEVARGLSRSLVGPQSDGLVQTESACVHDAHRAFIHRSHSGRYGMVNSEEGYQNLQRFLFGDVKVKASLSDMQLSFDPPQELPEATVSYQFEVQVAVRGLLILMHERSLAHLSAISLDKEEYGKQMAKGGLPLFSNFLLRSKRKDGTARYMIRIGVYSQVFQKGFLFSGDHVERLPLWSDYLTVQLEPSDTQAHVGYRATYSWASQNREPDTPLELRSSPGGATGQVALPERGQRVLGTSAAIRFESSNWD